MKNPKPLFCFSQPRTFRAPITRRLGWLLSTTLLAAASQAAPVYVDLKNLFDTDTIIETGGTGLSDPLDDTRGSLDAGTLPSGYADGNPFTLANGSTSFTFANLKASSLDAISINGQKITVASGQYGSIDLALLAAKGSYSNPFTEIQFNYADGSSDKKQFGPVPGWLNSPTAFDHAYYTYVDSSGVISIVDFKTDWGDTEATYLYDSLGNGNSDGNRFCDGNGYALYRIPVETSLTAATLGITVGNNFDIFIATAYADPTASPLDGYTEIANSMTIYGTEHKALGNLKLYEFDLAQYLAAGTGELYILFKDATPDNGWGPYIKNISLYTGVNKQFATQLAPAINTNNATVYAQFFTDGGTNEAPYLYDNSGSGPSSRKHRFADGNGSLTYKFQFPTNVNDAKLTVDMANNFEVSLSGPLPVTRYAQVAPGTSGETNYLVDAGNSVLGSNYRFADGSAYMVYQFTLPADVTKAIALVTVGNQYVISVAAGTNGDFTTVADYVAETGDPITDNSNLSAKTVKLDDYLANNPSKTIQIKLSDGLPEDGWGPSLTSIVIANKEDTGENTFTPVLNAMTLFNGVDVHDEINKGYYTLDLSSVLKTNNPQKEVYVKFTDASTSDGWGPGIFWMAAYSGTLDIQCDSLVFPAVKTGNGEPTEFGVNVLKRSYALNSAKTLKEIVLPAQPASEDNHAYLLAATLNPVAAQVALTITRGTDNNLLISWPTAAAGYALKTADSVTGTWSVPSQMIMTQGDNYVVTIPITAGTSKFYRLEK